MSSIAIVTDSDSSLPRELAEANGIRQVPINIHFGEETFRTEIDITDVALFERVDHDKALPTTSAPSPGQFADTFRAALADGADHIVCICVSGEISGTYNAALLAVDLMPEGTVTVVDSRAISMGQGFMALEAAAAARDGAGVEEILARMESVHERTTLYAGLATLKYLAMSGRVGQLAAGMASLLNIKPVLTMKDGKLDMLEKVRTRKKSWARMIELVAEGLGGASAEHLAVVHVNALDMARAFDTQLRATVDCPPETLFVEFTAGLSVHTGPGMIAVVTVAAEA
ncbi:MAG: DegV family protein [Anaerolineae bacterium]|nr:DegV family protein [Anaerolineae bacterium]